MIRVLKLTGWMLATVAALLGGSVLLLQLDSVSSWVGRRIATSLSGESLTIQVERVTGSWIRGLSFTGLRLSATSAHGDGGWNLEADTLTLGYRLVPFLKKTVSLSRVEGANVRFGLQMMSRQRAESGGEAQTSAGEPANRRWAVLADLVRLRNGRIEVWEAGIEEGGTPWALGEVSATIRDLHTRPGLLFILDTIQGRFRPSGRQDPWGHLLASGQWGSDSIRLDTLLLESPETQLSAGGTLPLSLRGPWQESWDLHLVADPVHLADLGPMLPSNLADSLRIRVRGRLNHAEGVTAAEIQADAGTGGRMEASGRVGVAGEAGATSAHIRLQGVDLLKWGLSETPGRIALDVSGTADSLRGSWEGAWSGRAGGLMAEGGASFIPGDWPSWSVEGTASYDSDQAFAEGSSAGAGNTLYAGTPSKGWLGPAAVTGEFRWAGNGLSLDSLSAAGEVSVGSGTVGRVNLTGARMAAQVEARGGTVGIRSGVTSSDSGRVLFAGVWERGGEFDRVRVDTLRFAQLNLRSFLQTGDSLPLPETLLNGYLRGSARRAAGGWTGQGTLLMDSTRIGSQELLRGRILAQGSSDGADVDLEISLGQGEVQGQMTLVSSGAAPEVTVHHMTFRDLDLGAHFGQADKATRLTGVLEGNAGGLRPKEAVASFRVSLDSSMVAGVILASADLEARSDSGRVNAHLRAVTKGTALEMEGNGSFLGATPTFDAQGTFRHLQPAVNGEIGDLRGALHSRFGLLGEGASLDSLQGSLWMEVDSARWEEVVLDEGYLELHAAGGALHLDTLSLRSQAVSLVGGGMLPISNSGGAVGEMRLEGRLHEGEQLAGWLKSESMAVGEATFRAGATGTLEDMNLTGEARVVGLLIDELQLQDLEFSAQGQRRGGEGFTQGSATLRIDQLRRGPFPLESFEAQALLEDRAALSVSGVAVIDGSRDGTFALRMEDPRDSPLVKIEGLEFRADADNWVLESPTSVHFDAGLGVDSLTIRAGSQEIQAHGRLARSGPLDLSLAVQNLRLGTFSDLIGFPALQGRVSGSVAFEGEGDSPQFTAGLQGRLEALNAPSSEVDLTASYAGQALTLEADVGMDGEPGLHAAATLPFRFSMADTTTGFLGGEPLLLRLSAEAFPLAWAGPFLSEDLIRDPKGTLNGAVTLTGVREAPALDGALSVRGAEARFPALGVRYERGRANLRFQGETILIDTLAIRTGDGSLSAAGTIGIPGLEYADYDVRVAATDFRAIRSAGVDATVSGSIQVAGRSLEPALTGSVVVRRADLYLDELTSNPRVEAVVLTEEDYQELARVFGYQERSRRRAPTRILDGMSLDLNVDLRRASWLRQRSNPEMAVQFSGNLSVQKEPGDSILLVGEVAAVPARSYVEQFGRRFSLTRGNLVFQGAPRATLIDLRAEHEVPSRDNPDQPEVVIALDISGTPEDLRLELSSSPPLEASDMVSYLAVGQPANRTLGGGEGSLAGAGEALALGRLSGAVEAYAREEVGLDVVEIITDGTEGVVLLAGRYVSPELYLGVRQPVSLHRSSGEASDRMSSPELEVELQAVRWLLLNLQAGGRSGVEFFVRSRISYE